MKKEKKSSYSCLLVLAILFRAAETVPAYVNLFYFNTTSNSTVTEQCECGVYGANSPLGMATGLVGVPKSANLQACESNMEFTVTEAPWIALIERGNCRFSEKIKLAAKKGAEAVVIYNAPESGSYLIPMAHSGASDIVAIMISNLKGLDILRRIEKGFQVTMVIEVGKKHAPWMNHYSIFFVSVSFFIVTAATVGYFIFYSARRFRVARAQNRRESLPEHVILSGDFARAVLSPAFFPGLPRQLKADAKKAIGQLQLRTLKQGDKEIGPDGDSCAVCIEVYKPNDVVRILTCNHLFHKTCIDPWLLEHRTCPMCKLDILKALGIEVDIEDGAESFQTTVSNEASNRASLNEEDNRSETASSGYASVQGTDEPTLEEHASSEHDNLYLVNNESQSPEVEVLPHLDNPSFETDETRVQEIKS
ncbi:E3 ubiquitin-protein ligase RNF128 isoform X1 [Gopherus evgoodei]|uniref:E3 ubiquitin-protein ligase RNF128 isoform X1 n=1 Tax=Gopherus evgoodei TaxID=1825980 RepID=UPI0011D01523|nr:E3 ubiquitin-protein ligase RNF128 isoform X1 [Gopherus evgoodei]